MTIFGDEEPEDAWDVSDPPPDQVRNIRLRLALLIAAEDSNGDELLGELAVLRAVLERIRVRRRTAREILRAEQLDEDLVFIVERLTT
jgi:hypothetical protein